jgi:hypothetical protein
MGKVARGLVGIYLLNIGNSRSSSRRFFSLLFFSPTRTFQEHFHSSVFAFLYQASGAYSVSVDACV